MSEDPNKVRNDPMVPEYWLVGEDLQDKIRAAGYDAETVDGIAVDFHDVLQAASRIETELVPAILATDPTDTAKLTELLEELRFEFNHIRWHGEAADGYLQLAATQISTTAKA